MIPAVTVEKQRATYLYRADDISPVATPTDIITLTGSANKKIRITKIGIAGAATAAALADMYVIKRLTANTGGTSTNPTATKYDTNDPTPSGVISLYTANPASLGTAANLECAKLYLPASATPAVEPTHYEREYGIAEAQCPALRGVAESLCINFNGAALAAGSSFYFYIEWTEEAA
jgi:hypothetical protein